MAEYGFSPAQAMDFPLLAYLGLVPAIIHRRGGESGANGPTSADEAGLAARQRCYAWLNQHFRILPQGEPGPAGALAAWLQERQNSTLES